MNRPQSNKNMTIDDIMKHHCIIAKELLQKYLITSYRDEGKQLKRDFIIKYFSWSGHNDNLRKARFIVYTTDGRIFKPSIRSFRKWFNSMRTFNTIKNILKYHNYSNWITNKDVMKLLKKFPETARVAVNYCNLKNITYNNDINLINIE